MLTTPLKVFLLVAAGTAAAVTTAYVTGALDRFIEAPPAVATLPPPAQAPQSGTAGQKGEAPAAPSAPTVGQPAATDIVAPSFDLVRVEPDGSLVIAGKAAANSEVEVLTGSKVIASTVAGPDGDFAVVLDDPLEPGGYQIVLRSTAQGGIVAMSTETAVVSVPEQESGQVLALVEKPGEPSKLITVPQPATPPAADKPETAGAEPKAPAETPPAASVPEQPAAEDGTAPGSQPQNPASAQAGEPKPEGGQERPAQTAEAKPAEQGAADGAQPRSETNTNDSAEKPAAETSSPSAAAAEPAVRVEAVEIDGNQVFVAGVSKPGALIRVYANDIFLGETRASPGGQFLVEALRNLPVGDYIIRADVIGEDGVKVIVRAAVPFQREPGESIAAVAPAVSAPTGSQEKTGEPAQAPGTSETPASTVGEQPGNPQAAATPPSAGSPPAGSLSEQQEPGAAPAEARTPAQQTASAEQSGSNQQVAAAPHSTSGDAVEPPSTTAPTLQQVDSSVIIRRGDSLWRISRRVYGRGIRYSTIYLANQDQISDPDRIWPGQIFRVPEKTSEGEAADMDAVADRKPPAAADGAGETKTR